MDRVTYAINLLSNNYFNKIERNMVAAEQVREMEKRLEALRRFL